MLELPLEVWAKIIAHLVQDTPLPGDNRDFDVPGQNDLCNVMRLNSACPILSSPTIASADVQTFHDLAAPYLYEKVVVADIASFIRNIGIVPNGDGIARPPKIIKSGIKTKEQLLAYVRTIQLVHRQPRRHTTYSDLLAPSNDAWRRLDQLPNDRLNGRLRDRLIENWEKEDIMSDLEGIEATRDLFISASDSFNPFPKLENMIIGGTGHNIWENWEPQMWDGEKDRLNMAKDLTRRIMYASRPSYMCSHDMSGPYALPADIASLWESFPFLRSYTAHIDGDSHVDISLVFLPSIILGTVNRWIFDRSPLQVDRQLNLIVSSLSELAAELVHVYGFSSAILADTCAELFWTGKGDTICSGYKK
jgi:hypothetical protein